MKYQTIQLWWLVITLVWVGVIFVACGSEPPTDDIRPLDELTQGTSHIVISTVVSQPIQTQVLSTPIIITTELASPLPSPQTTVQPNQQMIAEPIPVDSTTAVAAAIADLAQQQAIQPDLIVVQSVEAVDWPDSSLGCPQEGYMYAQAITPGFLIVLDVEGQTFEYHTDLDDYVVLCLVQ